MTTDTPHHLLVYSATAGGGFGTVFTSRGMPADAVAAVEALTGQTFDNADAAERVQFYALPSGLRVVTRTDMLLVDGDAERAWRGVTVGSRSGVYVAHALVFEPDVFLRFGNDPFAVLSRFTGWADRPSDLYRLYLSHRPLPADAPPPPPPTPSGRVRPSPAADWPVDTFPALYAAAERAADTTRGGGTLFMPGSSRAAEGALRRLFTLLPPDVRLACTFDTFARGAAPPRGVFWAVASPNSPPGGLAPAGTIDLSGRVAVPAAGEPSLAVRYLADALPRLGYDGTSRVLPNVLALGRAFADRRPPADLDDATAAEFLRVADDSPVGPAVAAVVTLATGTRLAPRVWDWARRLYDCRLMSPAAWVRAGFAVPPADVAGWTADALTADRRPLDADERAEVRGLAEWADSNRLRFLGPALGPPEPAGFFGGLFGMFRRTEDPLAGVVREMTAAEFDAVLPLLDDPVPGERYLGGPHTLRLFASEKGRALAPSRFAELAGKALTGLGPADAAVLLADARWEGDDLRRHADELLLGLVKHLLKEKRGADLAPLAGRVADASDATADALGRAVESARGAHPAFKRAVTARRSAVIDLRPPYDDPTPNSPTA